MFFLSQEPNKFQHPTIVALREYIHKLDAGRQSGASTAFDLDMILDVHSHPSQLGLFIIGNAYEHVFRFERHSVFPKILAEICPDYNVDNR